MGRTSQTQDDVEYGSGEWTMNIIKKYNLCQYKETLPNFTNLTICNL